ncbi:hypothetical protein CPB84DRAFT_1744759 [Gymnopilus junonius]|uniref:Alpha-type protein kinase domain-containing protein n=1 Tax=Gymnopilus junonius TaxID=109634 RepID=A0A9P5TRK5_GYMJU|nr:hypothetical protein CPB84DRAFT_1744759 [Gymnopilus junonius]
MCKFSGLDLAGHNKDFIGQTCDAFAHWTLVDSGTEFVPSDIQGKLTSSFWQSHSNTAHSKEKTMGLGDKGIAGIKEFCQQHKCNTICKNFSLEAMMKLLKILEEEEDDFNSENDEPVGDETRKGANNDDIGEGGDSTHA